MLDVNLWVQGWLFLIGILRIMAMSYGIRTYIDTDLQLRVLNVDSMSIELPINKLV